MKTHELIDYIEEHKTLISDGATGSNLQARGLDKGKAAEAWVLENPAAIQQLHMDFLKAGANILLTCTFGGNRFRLEHGGLADKVQEVNRKAVEIARKAIGEQEVLLAGSMGPLGQMLKPLGLLEIEDAQQAYGEQAKALSEAGVDFLLIETQFDISEAQAAIRGARSVSDLAIICSFSYDRGTKTMMGISPTRMVQGMEEFDLAALGINCGKSLDNNLTCLQELVAVTDKAVWFKPNAGLPTLDDTGNAIYSITPAEMGAQAPTWVDAGAAIIGGCCGTSPDHLAAIAAIACQ